MKFLILFYKDNTSAIALNERLTELGHSCLITEYCTSNHVFSAQKMKKPFGVGYKYSQSRSNFQEYEINDNVHHDFLKRIYNDIVSGGFDAVICCHEYPACAISCVKIRYNLNIPLYIVTTEYSYSPLCNDLAFNLLFVPTENIKHEFTIIGIASERLITSGIPVPNKFSLNISKQKAKAELCLNQDKFLCVIMAQEMNFGIVDNIIDAILQTPLSNYEILVISGNNSKIKYGINQKYSNYKNIASIGCTENEHLYMRASNLIITTPTGTSSTKAIVSNVPVILTKPQDRREVKNHEFLTKSGVAFDGESIYKTVLAFEAVLLHKIVNYDIMLKQDRFISKTSCNDICSKILEDIKNNIHNKKG